MTVFMDPEEDLEDAEIAKLLDEALAGYEHLPAAALQEIRESLGDYLAAHPDGRALLRQVKPDPTVQRSADVLSSGKEAVTTPKRKAPTG